MKIFIALKAFIKAYKDPQKGQKFLEEETKQPAVSTDTSHVRLLQQLQQSGRLIDFLKEDIQPFSDEQIGAAVRKIHQDSAKVLEELVTIRPLREEAEGASIQIPKGYNPAEIKIVGKVKGEPPFTGTLVHRGWKAQKRSLPKKAVDGLDVICPAEFEVK